MQIQAVSIGLRKQSFAIYRSYTVTPGKSARQLFRKKAVNHPKKNKWETITPGVKYERPICSFLFVTKRCDKYFDSASRTIIFAFKTTENCFKESSSLSDTKKHICAFFSHCRACQFSAFFASVVRSFHCYLASRWTVYAKTTHSCNVFFCADEGHIFDKENFGLQISITWNNRAQCSIVTLCKLV